MLIYNDKKEFVEATEDTLFRLGYNNAHELQEDAIDIADLFENKPGFVHNFKNFSWIDFILHSEQDNSKARIRCNGKIYECGFKIDDYVMQTQEESKGFAITLTDLIVVGDDENSHERAQEDSFSPEPQEPYTAPTNPEPTPVVEEMPQTPSLEDSGPLEFDLADSNDNFSAPMEDLSIPEPSMESESIEMPSFDESLEFETTFDTDPTSEAQSFDPQVPLETTDPVEEQLPNKEAPQTDNTALLQRLALETPADYVYDPSIAADELGLPADLIDEFVGDFIVQSKKFHPDLDEAIEKGDFDNVQILSHKLKGVAANLRIEDALEVLTFINSSQDVAKLKDYMTYLYQIVHRLEFGADATVPEVTAEPVSMQEIEIEPPVTQEAQPQEELLAPLKLESPVEDIAPIENFDLDIPLADEPEAIEMPNFIEMPQDDLSPVEEDSFDLDINIAPSEENDFGLDIDFDEPQISIDEEPFQSPEDDILDLSDSNFDLPDETAQTIEAPQEGILSHIDTNKFNIHEAAANLEIPMETLKSYIDDFVDQANGLKAELESALSSHNLETVKELATQLKGMSEALNMTHATQLLSTLQTTDDEDIAIENAKELFIFIREL